MRRIVGVLLAAGSARRFGGHKLLAELPGSEPVGVRAALNLIEVLPDSVAVIRPGDQALAEVLAHAGLEVIENPEAAAGMAGSLVAGVSARSDADGWLIALADMPWIRPSTTRSVCDALRAGAALVAPTFSGRRGHPVGFSARWRGRLLALTGDQGAGYLLAEAGTELLRLATRDSGILADIDFRSDLASPAQPDPGSRTDGRD